MATAVDGRWLVVGAPDSRDVPWGEAFVYKRGAAAAWAYVRKLQPPVDQRVPGIRFAVSVAMSSGFVVAGAPYQLDSNELPVGAVHVFYSSDNWQQTGGVLHPTGYGQDGDEFGYSVSISGPYVIVGAPGDNIELPEQGLYTDAGQVYIFELGAHEPGKWTWIDYDPNNPNENIIRHAPSPRPYARFGHSVCLSGEYAAVGAPGADEVHVYKREGTTWDSVGVLTPGLTDVDFGWSVSISGEYLAIGAPRYSEGLANAGAVYVYRRSGSTWALDAPGGAGEQPLRAYEPASEDQFGYSVSITRLSAEAVKLAVGGPGRDYQQSDAGMAYVYERTPTGWDDPIEAQKFVALDPVAQGLFGSSVYVNPESLLVGRPVEDDPSGPNRPPGSAYVAEFPLDSGGDTVPLKLDRNAPEIVSEGVVFTDFDHDGWSDVYQYQNCALMYFNGHASPEDPDHPWLCGWTMIFGPGTSYNCSAGDFTNDGFPDIATEPRPRDGRFYLLENLATGHKAACPHPPYQPNFGDGRGYLREGDARPDGWGTETICWGDSDGDGDADMFIPTQRYNPGDHGNFFYWNRFNTHRKLWEAAGSEDGPGRAGLWNMENAGAPVGPGYPNDPGPEGAQFADYDFDGDLDLLSNVVLYQNNWSNKPSDPKCPADPFDPNDVQAGARFFERLWPEESGILWKDKDEGVLFFDYDMDGDFDLLVTYLHNSQEVRIWENRGDGTFFDATDSRAPFPFLVRRPEKGKEGLSAADWDNDGDIDITTADGFRQNMLVESCDAPNSIARFENAVPPPDPNHPNLPLPVPTHAEPSWCDLDKDGDLDCGLSNWKRAPGDNNNEYMGIYTNTTYYVNPSDPNDPNNSPEPSRRFVRIRPAVVYDPNDRNYPAEPIDPSDCDDWWENEYGAAVEVRVLGETSGLRRRQFTASSAGYHNQNEYVLTFTVPQTPLPETLFDVVVDFPVRSEQGMWRVDKHVNCKLGNIDLADLYDTYREITVWRTGHVCINGALYDPSGPNVCDPNSVISALMLTAAGGLGLPGYDPNDPNAPYTLPSTSLGSRAVGMDFRVEQGKRIVIRELVVDGQLDTDPNACEYNLVLWTALPMIPLLPGAPHPNKPTWQTTVVTSPRNNRSYIPVHVELESGSYRLLARMTEYRGTLPADPNWTSEAVAVQRAFVLGDDQNPPPDICSHRGPRQPASDDRVYLTFRFTELE